MGVETKTGLGQESKESILQLPRSIILRGLPGGGKSTLSMEVRQLLHGTSVVLDPDYIDQSSRAYIAFSEELKAKKPQLSAIFYPYRYLLDQAREALGNQSSIIWSQTFSSIDGLMVTIENLEGIACNNGDTKFCSRLAVVDVQIDPEIAWQRVNARLSNGGHGMTREVFDNFVDRYEQVGENFPYKVINIRGEADVEESLAIINNNMNLWK